MAPWTAIVSSREDRSTGLLLLKARLVEPLRSHVEVLHLELFDAVSENAIHLAHVNQFVVDFVDATSSIVTIGALRLRGLVLMVKRCIGAISCTSICRFRSSQKSSMFRVTHLNLIFDFVGDHVLKVM